MHIFQRVVDKRNHVCICMNEWEWIDLQLRRRLLR